MKALSILGSTGSIGQSTLNLIDLYPERLQVVGLAAGYNGQLLLEQAKKYRPLLVAVFDPKTAKKLRTHLPDLEILEGTDGVSQVATMPEAKTVVAAISGFSGLVPTCKALETGKQVALANKETLVAAGNFIQKIQALKGGSIIPVDSEHNALHQCLRGNPSKNEVKKLILTASGGPFLDRSMESFSKITKRETMKHPTWKMGPKITVDSATMMNKGLEVIEAHHLFGIEPDRIAVAVHPQSVIHSMVEFIDGSVIAQMGITDMRSALLYALSFPERWQTRLPSVDLFSLPRLEFRKPNLTKFPCIRLAYEALREGKSFPTALNAANEVAVEAFLSNKISFTKIFKISAQVLESHRSQSIDTVETVLEVDHDSRDKAWTIVRSFTD